MEESNKYLILLNNSKQQLRMDPIKQKLTQFPKYFFCMQSNTLLIYDRTCIYIISKQQTKITDLGQLYTIVQIVYNHIKNIIIFLTSQGQMYAHFLTHKTQLQIKKSIKKQVLFDWVYSQDHIDLFIADNSAVKLYKVDDDKKTLKEVKSISGKFNSFLYSPLSQVLATFPYGDCRFVQTFVFQQERYKNWYKGPQVRINFENDANLVNNVKKNKSLGFKNSYLHTQCFSKQANQQYFAELLKMNKKCYLILYFSNEGKLKLYPIEEELSQREISIKLPSDSIPIFHAVDNMLIIHLKNERITFIYDVNSQNSQMLVSPFPIEHATEKNINPYEGSFYGKRHIMPNGLISKWSVNIEVIHHYLKNQTQIFDFLLKRKKAKSQLLRWLREKLLFIKQINLSKFWKLIFIKSLSGTHKQRDIITLTDLYSNVLYTLANDQLIPKEPVLNITLECIRQSNEMSIKVPFQLQKLLMELLLQCKKYQLLVYLCHNDIIKDNQSLAENLFHRSLKLKEPILNTLAIDMANRVCKPQKIFQFLILSQKVWEARRYVKENYQSIEILFLIYASKGIKNPSLKQQYLSFTRSFILKKFPSITEKYLDEAEYQANSSNKQQKQAIKI